jgi:tetratricopeptide (TPR) repeat protein
MTRTARCALLVVVALVVQVALPQVQRTAWAATDEDRKVTRAREQFERGQKLFDVGRFADALVAYQEAYAAFPAPEFLFNIGQCHRNLGHYEEAIFSFQKYLQLKPDAANRPAVEALIAELEAAKKRRDEQLIARKPKDDGIKPPPPSPFYKTWWFWTGVVVVAAAGGVGTYFLLQDDTPGLPGTDLGNVPFTP